MAHGAQSVLSDETGIGVAPRPGPLRLLVEGWRFVPHSYSIVNQKQCIELLKRPSVKLYHIDAPYWNQITDQFRGIYPDAEEEAMASLPAPDGEIDVALRMGYPYDFGPSACKTFVFVTCERMILKTCDIAATTATDERLLEDFLARIRHNNITIITPSEWSKRGLVRTGIDEDRIVVVPHGFDPEAFFPLSDEERARERKNRGIDDTFTFAHVSAMTGNKNVEGLIVAFLKIAKKYPKARLMLKGLDGIFRSDMWVHQELSRLSPHDRLLAKRTIFYNGSPLSIKDQSMIFKLADAYVSPYQSEGFNIPVLEAAACGLPVIVPDGGPTDEFTSEEFRLGIPSKLGDHHHDKSQWLLTNSDDIAAQMERVMLDNEWRERARKAGPEFVRARYTWSKVVDRLLSVVGI